MARLGRMILCPVFLLLFIIQGQAQELGANFNEHIDEPLVRVDEIRASGITWVRGFVNVTGKYLDVSNGAVTGVRTADINNSQETLYFVSAKQILGDRVNFVMSLKMPFEVLNDQVPVPGTSDYDYTIEAIETFLLSHDLADHIRILVLGNEPMWENGGDADDYKVFLNALADTVAVWKEKHSWDFMVFAGALNRISELYNNTTVQATVDVATNNPNIDGIDLHVHALQVSEAEDSFWQMRNGFGFTKKMITTEFSLNRLLSNKTTDELGTWGTENGYSPTMKMYEYLNHCKLQAYNGTPVSAAEFLSFFGSRPWYPQKWYKTFYDAFQQYDGYAYIGRFYAGLSNELYTANSQMWDLGSVYSSMYMGVDPETGFQIGSPLTYPEFEQIRNTVYPDFDPEAIPDPHEKKLLFHFDFENTLTDKSESHFVLKPVNTPVYTEGKYGYGVELNGISDYFDLKTVGIINTGKSPFTVCAWVYNRQTVPEGGEQVIGGIMHQLDGRVVLSCYQSSTLSTLGTWIGGASYKPESDAFKSNQWQHVAAVFEPVERTHTFYIDGIPIGTTVSENPFEQHVGGFRIGAHKSGTLDFWDGYMDELMLYRGALTESEINTLKNGEVINSVNPAMPLKQRILVYPNPVTNLLHVDYSGRIRTIEVFNMEGTRVATAENSRTIQTGHLENGIYLLGIKDEKGQLHHMKFIKQETP